MDKPNIILILTDHFRRDALHPELTPNLMRLAKQGTRFVNAYSASPLCQPARNCIITGMHASDNGICGNQQPPIGEELRRDTFMQHLRAAGYTTALVGKHHYIDRFGIGMDVTEDDGQLRGYGFDSVFQVVDDGENGHNDDEYTRYLASERRLDEFRTMLAAGPPVHPFEPDASADGFIGVNGIRFVEEYDGEQPFYLNLSFVGPHPPFWHPGEETPEPGSVLKPPKEAGDVESVNRRRAHYLAKCALIDDYVGRLVETLETKGILDDTVIVFTSDHGDMLGDRGVWDKRYFYEESVGIPLFIAGGPIQGEQRMCGARVSKALVSHLDIYPTMLDLAGIAAERDRKRPGASLLRLLDETVPGHPHVIAELATAMMIRTGNWKLVYDPQAGGVQQLHNLIADPEEMVNLAGTAGYEQIIAGLVAQLLADKIRRSQVTQVKEEQRLQRAHIG